jgi:hypothetical protein
MCAICELKIEFNIGHPQALTVAVATREAMDAATLPETAVDGALSNMKLRMAAIEALKGSPFKVFLKMFRCEQV